MSVAFIRICGRKVKATWEGKSVVVQIVDRCVACQIFDLDFSPTAFGEIGPMDKGRLHGMTVSIPRHYLDHTTHNWCSKTLPVGIHVNSQRKSLDFRNLRHSTFVVSVKSYLPRYPVDYLNIDVPQFDTPSLCLFFQFLLCFFYPYPNLYSSTCNSWKWAGFLHEV